MDALVEEIASTATARLHPLGLVPESLSAKVFDFIVQSSLGLVGLAAAVDVIAADCRFNHWVGTYLKKNLTDKEQWMKLLDEGETNENRCKAAMAAFAAGGPLEELCDELLEVAAWLNKRSV